MKIYVDKDTCTGCEVCVEKAPDIFTMKNGIAIVINKNPDNSYKNIIMEAIDECPSDSITLED